MKIYDVQQGSPEWLNLRCGIPTASEFDSIITPGGKPSTSAERYLHSLLAEKMMGHPRITSVSTWMERGSEMESEAVEFYELQRNVDTDKVGFITNDAGTIGASPDRLVGENGLLEIKCPAEHTHVGYLIKKSVDQKYYPQVQGQLWIAERQFADIVSYNPEMPMALIHVERDEDFIKLLKEAVEQFSALLEAAARDLTKRGWIKVPPPSPEGGVGNGRAASVSDAAPSDKASGVEAGNVDGAGTADRPAAPLAAWQISFFGKLAPLKKADEAKYYELLLKHGYHHANEVPTRAKALEIFEEMKGAINVV